MLDTTFKSAVPSILIKGLSDEHFRRLTDPATDPARALTRMNMAEDRQINHLADLPSQEEIEDSLNAHVREGKSARDLITTLLHPFVDETTYVDLDPGKGLKRPSYALSISDFGFSVHRSSTRDVAHYLHDVAERLWAHEVGDRAPEGSKTFQIGYPGSGYSTRRMSIKARSGAIARAAYVAAFGGSPSSIEVPLEMGAADILPHVVAARSVLAGKELGAPRFRQQAIDLIAAVEDLRAATTVVLRMDKDISTRDQHWITLTPSAEQPIEILNKDPEPDSGHARVAFAARYRVLIETIQEVLERHPVLKELPASCKVEMSGEPVFLQTQIIDTKKSTSSPDRYISGSLLEYGELNALSARLGDLSEYVPVETTYWRMEIMSRGRSKMTWDLSGPTLADAFAKAIQDEDSRSSMVLFDLAIDLACDQDGQAPGVTLYRVFN